MPTADVTRKKAEQLLDIIDLGTKIQAESISLSNTAKAGFKEFSQWTRSTLLNELLAGTLQAAGLKSLENEFLTYWNESAGPDIEDFWKSIQGQDLPFKRKDFLKTVLQKGRFRNVHQAIATRSEWRELKKHPLFTQRMDKESIERLDQVVQEDEARRVGVLKACLQKGSIAKSQYLSFGDSMGYLQHCSLFDEHFNEQEYKDLVTIWENVA